MNAIFRLTLLFLILFVAGQTWGISVTQHQYDAEDVTHDVNEYVYDATINLHVCCGDLSIEPQAQDVQDGYFLALISDFDVPNRAVSNIKDITKPGSKLPNIKTDAPKSEFEKNLLGDGFSQSTIPTKNGPINVFNKGEKKFTTRSFSNSTDGPTAEVFKNNRPLSKIRLGEK